MPALGLDHIVLVNADVETTLEWYTRHAGLTPVNVEEWRAGKAFFPSLRIDATTIIDFIPGDPSDPEGRGHLDHLCFVMSQEDVAALEGDPEVEVVDKGERSGAQGLGQSIYVRDPDDLLVEFRYYPR